MNMEYNFPVVSDWAFRANKHGTFLIGKVTGSDKFSEGERVRTSPVQRISHFGRDKIIVTTRNSYYIIYKEEVNYKYRKAFPNYWRDIIYESQL